MQVRFRRTDLLFRHDQPLTDPYADAKRAQARARGEDLSTLPLELPGLPLAVDNGRFRVGPTVLDMLVRRRWRFDALPSETQSAVRAALGPDDKPPHAVAAWSARPLDSLWPRPGETQRISQRSLDDQVDGDFERTLHHPFLASLASGGQPRDGAPSEEWVRVEKLTTCMIGEYVYRVACGVFGGLEQAHEAVAERARAAWEADLQRALALWDRVHAAPGKVLVETHAIEALRPICSVSQEVERSVMREVCDWLGVDPDMPVRRPRGRPPGVQPNAEQGDVIRVELQQDGTVRGRFIGDFDGIATGTELHLLRLGVLVSVLGALRLQKRVVDHQLLEAWLDSAVPDWRDRVVDEAEVPRPSGDGDPFEVLGVAPDAPMDEITAAFRRTLKAVHPDTGGASPWITRSIVEAYRKIREARRATRSQPS